MIHFVPRKLHVPIPAFLGLTMKQAFLLVAFGMAWGIGGVMLTDGLSLLLWLGIGGLIELVLYLLCNLSGKLRRGFFMHYFQYFMEKRKVPPRFAGRKRFYKDN
jgi:hypothetical protein